MAKPKVNVNDLAKTGIEGLKSVLTGLTQAHPTSIGLIIMASCTALIATSESPKVRHGAENLYSGAQSIALASVVAPVVVGGLSSLGDIFGGAFKK